MTSYPCPHCGKYIETERVGKTRLDNLYKTNNTAEWAKRNLRVLGDMAERHPLPDWYVKEIRRIQVGIDLTE